MKDLFSTAPKKQSKEIEIATNYALQIPHIKDRELKRKEIRGCIASCIDALKKSSVKAQ